MVIHVVKNASRPVFGELSPVPDGKCFVFQTVCIVTLRRVLCKLFLREQQLSNCGAIDKEIGKMDSSRTYKGDCFYYPIAIY